MDQGRVRPKGHTFNCTLAARVAHLSDEPVISL